MSSGVLSPSVFIEFKGRMYDARHGGPFDRGSADSYYNRPCVPHYFTGDTYSSTRIDESKMTKPQIRAYKAGYKYNEMLGDKKY